jgi:cytochrome P450
VQCTQEQACLPATPGSAACAARSHSSVTFHAEIVAEAYARDLPDSSKAFWACLRRAFPDAMRSKWQYERAISNVALVYAAGTETTVAGISMTLAALAVHPESMRKLEQVRILLCLAVLRCASCC